MLKRKRSDAAPAARKARNPSGLMNWFLGVAFVSVLVVLGAAGYGTFALYQYLVINDAKNASVGIGRALAERERELFVSTASGAPKIAVAPENFPALDERMRKYLIPFNMYKIKVFAADTKIVYSTDRSIVGKVDTTNTKLQNALLKGDVTPKLATKDSVKDLGGAEKFHVDVVETYLPIRDENNLIIGAFEVYTDVSGYRRDMTSVMALVLTVALAVMALVVVALFIPMRKGVFQLMDLTEQLAHRRANPAGVH